MCIYKQNIEYIVFIKKLVVLLYIFPNKLIKLAVCPSSLSLSLVLMKPLETVLQCNNGYR